MLNRDQVDFYRQHGFIHVKQMFSETEVAAMDDDLEWLISTWAGKGPGWSGSWRQKYMDEETEQRSQLVALHDLHRYSKAWCDAVTDTRLTSVVADLIGDNVELHHTTLHAKPRETGHPFPMHQDWAFYKHEDERYVDCIIHLDDTSDENGCLRFLDGSHRGGPRQHVVQNEDGTPCTPHLPVDEWNLDDTVAVPARRGDVVIFNIYMIHGSRINQTEMMRRVVRVGYRSPDNRQIAGQSMGRPGLIVQGRRPRTHGQVPHPTTV